MPAPDFNQARWRKSSRSNGGGAACVMVAVTPDATGIKDSKLGQDSPILALSPHAWSAFLNAIKNDEHELS